MTGVLRRLGVVVHPVRDVDGALSTLRGWTQERGLELVQVPAGDQEREVAPSMPAEDCDLVVAVGGDGTVLAAIRAAAAAGRPVLGVSCGSLGALATVSFDALEDALDRFADGAWTALELPALQIDVEDGPDAHAFNDLVVVRDGGGQISASVLADGVLYGRFAGDGIIVSTAVGASGYGMAAGGPIIAPGVGCWLMTPLTVHGGNVPPLVLGPGTRLRVDVDGGHGGARLEIDGQPAHTDGLTFTVTLRPSPAALVRLGDEEPALSGLRRRGIVSDSPRILARDARGEPARQPRT